MANQGTVYTPPAPQPTPQRIKPSAAPTGKTVSTSKQMQSVTAPSKIEESSTPKKAVAPSPAPKPAAKKTLRSTRPVPQPVKVNSAKEEVASILGGSSMVRTDPEMAAKIEARKAAEAEKEKKERARKRKAALRGL